MLSSRINFWLTIFLFLLISSCNNVTGPIVEGISFEGLLTIRLDVGEEKYVDVRVDYDGKESEWNPDGVIWSVQDGDVVRVEEGNFIGLSSGETIVKAEYEGFSDEVTVRVRGEQSLSFGDYTYPEQAEKGETISTYINIVNESTEAPNSELEIELYLEPRSNVANFERLIGTARVSNIGLENIDNVLVEGTIPEGIDSGTYYFFYKGFLPKNGIGFIDFSTFTEPGVEIYGAIKPSVNTLNVKNITSSSATVNSEVVSDGEGTIFEKGIYWSKVGIPSESDNKVLSNSSGANFGITISGLNSQEKIFARAFATNEKGTSFGETIEFYTSVLDIDGNEYPLVRIGDYVIMSKNLNSTNYKNGDLIENVVDGVDWEETSSGAWAYYENNNSNSNYGKLYNWFAVNDSRGICPGDNRLKIPTITIMDEIYNTLGGKNIAGSKMKSTSSDWRSTNGATNSSGFSGLPGGERYGDAREWAQDLNIERGYFNGKGDYGSWWLSNSYSSDQAYEFSLIYNTNQVTELNNYKNSGLSVRCVSDYSDY